jgi:hypothetical protein
MVFLTSNLGAAEMSSPFDDTTVAVIDIAWRLAVDWASSLSFLEHETSGPTSGWALLPVDQITGLRDLRKLLEMVERMHSEQQMHMVLEFDVISAVLARRSICG